MSVQDFLSFLSMGLVLFLLLCVLGGVFWVGRFVQLMALSDEDFPGRNDKLLWVVAFVAANVFAAFAFGQWRRLMLEMRAAGRAGNHSQDRKSTT